MRRLSLITIIAAAVALAAAGSALTEPLPPGQVQPPVLKAEPWNTPQPVIGYGTTTTCVLPQQPVEVLFHVENRSHKDEMIVITPYGIASPGEFIYSQKGPTYPVDTTRSGLVETTRFPQWHWAFKLKRGATHDLHMYVLKAPIPYIPDPKTQPGFQPRLYLYAQGNVRYSNVEIDLNTRPVFCLQR